MKKLMRYIIFLFVVQFATGQMAEPQVKLAVLGQEISVEGLNERHLNKIATKVERMVSRYGIISTNYIEDFIIVPDFEIYTDDAVEGTYGKIYDIEGELTLKAVNLSTGSRLAAPFPFELKGSSRDSRDDAITKAIGKIKTSGPEIEEFVVGIKEKILAHYQANCESICGKAEKAISLGQLEQAILLLNSVPNNLSGNCNTRVAELLDLAYTKYTVQQCSEIITEAKQAISEGKVNYAKSLLDMIDVSSSCNEAKQTILSELKGESDSTSSNEVKQQVAHRRAEKMQKVSESAASKDDKAVLCAKRIITDCG